MNAALYNQDYFAGVERIADGSVDLVIADPPYGLVNQATPEQRARLVTEFRSMLVRIYSNALGVYRGQTMRVQPVRMAKDATDVTVRNQYLSPGKPPLAVDYSMRKVDGTWKIYDIVAEGISLVLTYRGEFEQAVQQGGVDGLIKQLAEKNAPPRERSSG